jgi:hypothetical protein
MKIYEIISEQSITEGSGSLIAGGLEKAAIGAEKLGKFFKNPLKAITSSPKSELIDKAASEVNDLVKAKRGTIDINKAIELKTVAVDHDINDYVARSLKSAEIKKGEKLTADEVRRITAKAEKDAIEYHGHEIWKDPAAVEKIASKAKSDRLLHAVGLTGEWTDWVSFGGLFKTAFRAWGWYELYQPVGDYIDNMKVADEYLKSGPPDGFTQEQYNAYQNKQMSLVIGRLGALIAAGYISKGNFIIKAVRKYLPGADLAALATNAGLKHWINSPHVTENIATLFMSDIMAGNTESGFPGLGSLAVDAKNALQSALGFEKKPATGQSSGGALPATATPGAQQAISNSSSGTTPSDSGSSNAAPSNGTDLSKYVQRPDNPALIWDPAKPLSIMLKPPGWQPK